MEKWYAASLEAVQTNLKTDIRDGLSEAEARNRIGEYGYNELRAEKKVTIWQMIFNQFKDFLVLVLVAAGVVSLAVGETADAIVILIIVIVNAVLGATQEQRASKALDALKKMASPRAAVLRDGRTVEIPVREIVPGDVVLIETGDFIPADLRLIESINLKIDESSLTGESLAVEKSSEKVVPTETAVGDRENSAFMGTVVTYGRGKGLVTDTGMQTEIGQIAEMLESYEEESTPLQKKLAGFGRLLGYIAIAIIVIVFVLGLLRNEPLLKMFMTSVSLAVAAIPEGLPAIVTIVLALGMRRMIGRHAIVKRLHAVETLGSVTTICSDKTGTLTKNEMTVVRVHTAEKTYEVGGRGYEPEGEFRSDGRSADPAHDQALELILRDGALNNDSKLERDEGGTWKIIGDPTEGALVVAAMKAGIDPAAATETEPRRKEIPFDSERKMMTTFHSRTEGGFRAYTKGAPDAVLARAKSIFRNGKTEPLNAALRQEMLDANTAMAGESLRVLGFAFRDLEALPEKPSAETDERDLVFIGLMGMIDPARPEAIRAVDVCKQAGIRTVMITGDYKETAAAIAGEIGILNPESDGSAPALSGAELDRIPEEKLPETVRHTNVFARVSPSHKVKIVNALRTNGEIVSMTGDGVNDAPALKRADIGVAMGITGTDVAKETADMILTDDNFASIVNAVEEGRVIYSNIRKFIFFLLSCNVAEILIIFIAMLLGWPIPLEPIQILWLNLITDAFPALALGLEKAEPGVMSRPPRDPAESIIDWKMRTGIIVQSVAMTAAVLGVFRLSFTLYPDNLPMAENFAFVTLIVSELLRSYTARSEIYSIFRLKITSNPYVLAGTGISLVMLLIVLYVPFLQPIFSTVAIGVGPWLIALGFAFIPSVVAELTKIFIRMRERKLGLSL